MKYYIHFLNILLLFLCSITTNTQAAYIEIVFDNTINASGGIFGPGCCQAGNEIVLNGKARKIVQLSWLVNSQNTNIAADFETNIYENDGIDGAPDSLIWGSGLLTGLNISATNPFLDIVVPEITVPDTITVTSKIFNSTPVALGRVYGEPPSIGSVNTSWVEGSPEGWHQAFGPWGLKVTAIPEPYPISLLIIAGFMIVYFSRYETSSR